MFYPAGEISQKLNPNFIAQEANQLHVNPAVIAQLQNMTQSVVGEFEKNVNTLSTNFANFLQQDPAPSHEKVMQKLNTAQSKIDRAHDQMIDQIKTNLQGQASPAAIDQFVEDVKAKVAEYTHLDDKVRQDPELNKRMPPRSLFEMVTPPQAQAPAAAPPAPQTAVGAQAPSQAPAAAVGTTQLSTDDKNAILDMLDKKKAENSDPVYQRLINDLETCVKTSGSWEELGAKLTGLLQGTGYGGNQDFYMKYPELIPNHSEYPPPMDDVFHGLWNEIFMSGSNPTWEPYPGAPEFTTMDQKYLSLYNQQPPPAQGSLLWTLMNQIKQYGSSDAHLDDVAKWAQSEITNRSDVYVNATLDDMQTFMSTATTSDITVTDPLYSSYQAIADFAKSGTTQSQLAKEIQALYNRCTTPEALIKAINSLLNKNSPQDIYMANGGVDFSKDLTTLSSTVKINVPNYTTMDAKCLSVNQWAKTLSGTDLAVANQLLSIIAQLGSAATQADLTSRAQSVIDTRDPPYANALPSTWQKFTDLTGAKDAILGCYNSVAQWEGSYPSGSPMSKFAEDMKKFCYSCKTLQDFVSSINQFMQQKSPQDVYMSYGAGKDGKIITDADLQKLGTLLPGMTIPTFTKMDSAYKMVEANIADTEVYKPRDMLLLKVLEAKILSLGSSDQNNNPAILIQWGRDMRSTNPPSPEYNEALAAGQVAFDNAISQVE